ncbi:phosphatidate cytidylyltransferase [Marisediminicola sp. UYEF4]|uniref:phosphatidate cytidylyltransferase n=1 Tax=Marisediminicola sp. UYEF4 TaxID=1756384 RepID=UPI003399ECBA
MRQGREDLEARAAATREEIRAQIATTRAHLDDANEKLEAKAGRNLPLAIGFGLVLGVSMLLSLILVKSFFMLVAAALVAFTAFELASALWFAGRYVPRVPTIISAVAIVPAAFYLGASGAWLVFLAGVLLVGLWRAAEQVRPSRRGTALEFWKDLGAGTLVQAYVPFLGSFAVVMAAQDGGEWWTLAFLLIVISTDTGAYASGLLFGKHPMAPKISPKKTWEGFAGSVLVALVVGVVLALFMVGQPWWLGVIFGITMVATATLGDLTESLIKRDLGIKDISTWLPGHGGFLDRLDSVLPSAIATYALFLIFA